VTPDELKAAREKLGVTQVEFAKALEVSLRTLSGWEQGVRNDNTKHTIPAPVALLVKLALRHPVVRRELGIRS
jgi:putative transcriptional regulator